MASVFISYRRDDSAACSGRLYDRLCEHFGSGNVFMDVDDIRPGEDFVKAIERHVKTSRAALVMIGAHWLSIRDALGHRRLDDPEDFVRREIAAALAAQRLVIPILVDGATMPGEHDLPEDIRALARAQAVELADARFHTDAARVIARLDEAGIGRHPWTRRAIFLGSAALALTAIAGWLGWRRWGVGGEQNFVGDWAADIRYDWGVAERETFSFRMHGGALVGTAGFLGVPRALEAVELDGNVLRFATRSTELMGDVSRELRHHYVGQLRGAEIAFVMRTEGGTEPHPPLDFTARRAHQP